jgi:hypothetical protein
MSKDGKECGTRSSISIVEYNYTVIRNFQLKIPEILKEKQKTSNVNVQYVNKLMTVYLNKCVRKIVDLLSFRHIK